MEHIWAADEMGEQREALVAFAERRLGRDRRHLAEDLVHEVFACAFERGDLPKESPRLAAYLRRAVLNRMASHWKRESRQRDELDPEEEQAAGARVGAADRADRRRLRELRCRLRFEDQAALFLRGQLGCGFETLGAVLGMSSEQAARRFHARAVQRLVECARSELGHQET